MRRELQVSTLRNFVEDLPDEDRTPEIIRNEIRDKSRLLNFQLDEDAVEDIARIFELQFSVTQDFGFVVRRNNSEPWWRSAVEDGLQTHYSSRFHEYLKGDTDTQLPVIVVNRTNEITDQIVDLAGNPNLDGHWKRRGMVIGHVQSGKTLNYSSVITKAADAGYRVIILLAGITNSLRRQTQDRIDHAFIGRQSSEANIVGNRIGAAKFVTTGDVRHPNYLTSLEKDFSKSSALATRGVQFSTSTEPVIFVCKKNVSTLRNIYEFLENEIESSGLDQPFLMIDDEADNASINTLLHQDKVTAINQSLRKILSLFSRSSYIGYTATPFANIFIDPDTEDEMGNDDLFPTDFIKTLEAPTNYVGPDEVFGENGRLRDTMVLSPSDYQNILDLKHKSNLQLESLPKSLEEAVLAFILAKAIRFWRGQQKKHCTMMVNVSRFNAVQQQTHTLISEYLERIRNDINNNARLEVYPEKSALHDLKRLYQNEFLEKAKPEQEADYPNWSELDLFRAVRFMQVVQVNMTSAPLNYDNHPEGLTVIAIGGLALSRGLTLEGLTVSYILRNASAYDTLMQMGRWFGYRPGYEDLCRLYIPNSSKAHYEKTAQAISELRDELQVMQDLGKTPAEFGLKVRSHPQALAITAANKMKSARTVDFFHGLGGKTLEGHAVYRTDEDNNHNRAITSAFLNSLGTPMPRSAEIKQPDLFWESVPRKKILDFIKKFRLPSVCNEFEYNMELGTSVFGEFVNSGKEHLSDWHVAVANGIKAQVMSPNSLLADIELVEFRRDSGKIDQASAGQVFSFTKSRKVSTPVHAEFGLKKSDIQELKDMQTPDNTGKKKQISSVIYNTKRTKPLLLIYEINASYENEQVFSMPAVSFAVHFPDNENFRTVKVTYAINKIAQQQELPLFDEEDGDEVAELNELQEGLL
jgi:hypothetical protein